MKHIIYRNTALLLLSLFPVISLSAQDNFEEFYLKRENFENYLSELRNEFGNKKIIPADLELECLAALSFYPELKNTDIEFRFGQLNFTMVSKPKFRSVLKNKTERKYLILIQRT